ncbi:MAG TPA: hypothetical protein VI357_25205, partial [Mycobacteriales bacterium]
PGRRLRAAVRALDVDGPAWAAADPGEAAHATWFLRRVAQLTGDVTAHDLAAVWAFRAGTAVVPEPPPDHALTAAHRLLADYCETGRDLGLRRARVIATSLGQRPGGRVDVHEGRWAGLLLSLECHRPADAVLPGRPDHAT